jgi:hypothetical protein
MDNPNAFPTANGGAGMTLRDYFAGQALAGLASIALDDGDMLMGWADMSKAAFKAADAMLAERTKEQSNG